MGCRPRFDHDQCDLVRVAGLPDQAQLFEYVRGSKVRQTDVFQSTGNTTEAFKAAGKTLQATYDFPLNTHGSIGPSCAVADFKDGQLTVWTPAQGPHLQRLQLATMLQLAPEKVRCIYVEGAGCYGRNGADDCSSEAALIAKEIGRPVRLQWMRADEHGWDPKGPPALLDYRALIDDQGRIAAWEADGYLPERPMQRSGVTLLAATLADLPKFGPPERQPHQSRPRHSLRCDQQQIDGALARGHTTSGGVDSRAWAHAKHLRQ